MTAIPVRPRTARSAGTAPFIPFDATFGAGGQVDGFAAQLTARSEPTVRPDGRILLTGFTTAGEHVLAAFRPNGTPDLQFGAGGRCAVPTGTPHAEPNSDLVTVQADGRILLGGVIPAANEFDTPRISIARVTAGGALDTGFSSDGRLSLSFPVERSFLFLAGLLVDEAGRILVVATTSGSMLLARLAANGELDRSFGTEGKLVLALPGQLGRIAAAMFDSDGRLVAAGTTARPDSQFDLLITRVTADGGFDDSFGFNGSTLLDLGQGTDSVSRLRIDGPGRILVAGSADRVGDDVDAAVVRLLPDGRPDPDFGVDGVRRLQTGKQLGRHRVTGLTALSDGRVALAGHFALTGEGTQGDPDYRVPQPFVGVLTSEGLPDRSFDGGDGVVFLPRPLASNFVRLVATGADKLLIFVRDSILRLLSSTEFGSLSMSIAPSANPAPPGPLTLTVRVQNLGDSVSGGVLRLRCSKSVVVVSGTHVAATVEPNRIDVIGKVLGIPPGDAAVLILRTTVNGFEEGITLSGSVAVGAPDENPADNAAAAFVDVVRGEVS